MNRRGFLKRLVAGMAGSGTLFFVNACIAPLISATARDKSAGDPWQCVNCGHLTRSKEDLSGTRCPRCTKRMLRKITEVEMVEALEKLGG
jgi:DNA-directed RNA polymerase subunit RPC12/RpoP